MSPDIDCFFFPELTFRSWFLLFCSVFKDLFFAPFRVPDYITTSLCPLQAFFLSFFYQCRSPLAPVYISKYPPLMSNLFFTFFTLYKYLFILSISIYIYITKSINYFKFSETLFLLCSYFFYILYDISLLHMKCYNISSNVFFYFHVLKIFMKISCKNNLFVYNTCIRVHILNTRGREVYEKT